MIINNTSITINTIKALNAVKIAAENTAPKIKPITAAKATTNIPRIYSPQQRFFLGFIQQISS